jgi:hypothetical protein
MTYGFFFAFGWMVRSSLSFAFVLAHADADARRNRAGSMARESLIVAPWVKGLRAS